MWKNFFPALSALDRSQLECSKDRRKNFLRNYKTMVLKSIHKILEVETENTGKTCKCSTGCTCLESESLTDKNSSERAWLPDQFLTKQTTGGLPRRELASLIWRSRSSKCFWLVESSTSAGLDQEREVGLGWEMGEWWSYMTG